MFLSHLIRFALSVAPLMLVVSGCMPEFPFATDDITSGSGGGGEIVLHMPVENGKSLRCTQGAGGGYSHSATNTQHDIDFDTANDADEEIYAPIGGTAYVHTDSATSGFGYHINIDIGDGKYVVIGHFKEIFISDESEVAVGQLIGYEGCTGSCTGDHIHMGLHEGDASKDAVSGTSVEVSYRLTDTSQEDATEAIISSDDLVCGMDENDMGHVYQSALPVTLWHPDGTLVKMSSDPKVYVLTGGNRQWFEDEQVFWSYNHDFEDMVLVSDEELSCYGSGQELTEETQIDAVVDSWGTVWLLVGDESDGDAYRIPLQDTAWESVLYTWGLGYTESTIPTSTNLSEDMLAYDVQSGYAGFRDGTLVTEVSTSDVYVISNAVAVPIKDWETYLMLGFHDRDVLVVDDGVVAQVHENVGSCLGGVWCLDQEAITTCGGGFDLGNDGNFGGDQDDEPEDNQEEDDEEQEGPDEEDVDDEPEEDDEPAAQDCDGEDACIADTDGDGVSESLLMIENQWLTSSLDGLPAFVYGNGGCFDGSLEMHDLVYASENYYRIDFSEFAYDCSVELSLISSVGTDGQSPEDGMGNWYWWQNADICSAGTELCELMENGMDWEEWLLSVQWDTTSGLSANGNGFTSNDQL